MILQQEVCSVAYHSTEWKLLVETGWVTVVVDMWLDKPLGKLIQTATMLRETRVYYHG